MKVQQVKACWCNVRNIIIEPRFVVNSLGAVMTDVQYVWPVSRET